jgi:hypothetical protein
MANVRSTGNTAVHNQLDHDERWLLVERIISSAAFRKAGRLRELIRHLAELSIQGQVSDLTEQRIGEAVFGKAAGYSPVEDSSVRVHMRQLRLKLHEYFDSEGRDEPLVVEIPKGSYGLSFHPVPMPAAAPAPPEAATIAKGTGKLTMRLPWVAVVALTGLSMLLWMRVRTPVHAPAPWPLSAVFNGRRTQIVLSDATYGIRRLLSGKPVSLEEYIKRDFQRAPDDLPGHANDTDDYLERYSADALLTSYANVAVATNFLRLLPDRLDQVAVRSARDLRMRDLEDGNYVFLGSPASNPWVLLFENRLNFQEVRSDEIRGAVKFFSNKNPQAGELATYQGLPRTGMRGVDFASIALLPTDSTRGNVLIIQGLQQEGTEAAGLFLCDEAGRQKLKKALGIDRDPGAPVYFEVLLRVEAVGGSPTSSKIVASRILKP